VKKQDKEAGSEEEGKKGAARAAFEFDASKVAKQVEEIGDAVTTLRKYFKDKLIVLMLNDVTGVSKRDIGNILDALPNLANVYLKQRK
jgi:hypothetical protein